MCHALLGAQETLEVNIGIACPNKLQEMSETAMADPKIFQRQVAIPKNGHKNFQNLSLLRLYPNKTQCPYIVKKTCSPR